MANFNPNDYETVDSRIKRFYKDYPDGAIRTHLVEAVGAVGATRWTVKASIWKQADADAPDGTGYAFEVDGTGMANRTSALENCETSAIGRALANIGYSGDKRASREEMAKTQQAAPKPVSVAAPDGWEADVAGCETVDEIQEFYEMASAAGWWSPVVAAACTARKKELSGG